MARQRHSDTQIFDIVKKLGEKSYPQYICINPNKGYVRKHCRLIEIKCIEKNHLNYNKTKVYELGNLQKNTNPFFINGDQFKTNSLELTKQMNEYGQKAYSKFICVNPDYGQTIHKKRLVLLKCTNKDSKYYNQVKVVHVSNIQKGRDPFFEKKDLIEHDSVHPQIEKILRSFNLEYKKEFKIGIGSRIDFKFITPTKKIYWIEAKQSAKFHSKKNQISRYKKLAKLKKHNVKELFLVDPIGSHKAHGFISFKEFKNKLKQLLSSNL